MKNCNVCDDHRTISVEWSAENGAKATTVFRCPNCGADREDEAVSMVAQLIKERQSPLYRRHVEKSVERIAEPDLHESFAKLVREEMAEVPLGGFQYEPGPKPEAQDAAIIEFKRGEEVIYVVSSARELRMNAEPSQLAALAAAKVQSALRQLRANGMLEALA